MIRPRDQRVLQEQLLPQFEGSTVILMDLGRVRLILPSNTPSAVVSITSEGSKPVS